ncbi:MAG: nuclear transport factor 2 family protein [Planctomycetota bacterium]|jgi:hypothetical protein
MKHTITLVLASLTLAGCATHHHTHRANERATEIHHSRDAIDLVLDEFHDAASRADLDRYFSHLSSRGHFLGTDASERWSKQAFEEYARPFFEAGQGWTYTPLSRHVQIDLDRKCAWFDETLESENYGTSRGSGTLILEHDGRWRIAQYHLTFPIPNDIARDITDQIKAYEASTE